jgi:CRP-like cAMP-binding protein
MGKTQTDLMNGLTEAQAEQLQALGQTTRISAQHVLFDLGNVAEQVYVVVRGQIRLTLPMRVRGKEEDVLIEERLAGETLGWSGLIPPHRFTLKASASVDSELIAFSRSALLEHFAAHPAVAVAVTRNVAAVIGHRLQVFQAMWLREMQRTIELRYS